MGIKFLMLDEERKYFSLVSDIFDVTGHKLLVALDEQKAKELLNATSFDVFLADIKHFNFWVSIIKEGKYALPIFFLEDYEDAQKLKALGFTDLNFVPLPFNPLDLLTKAVWLNKEEYDPNMLSSIGPVNLLVQLLRRSASSIITLNSGTKKCGIFMKEGRVLGSTCQMETLKEVLASEEVKIELFPYTGEDYLEESFTGNEEFFSGIFSAFSPSLQEREEFVAIPKVANLAEPIELYRGLFWVGVCDSKSLTHLNCYLRIYEKGDVKIPILINAGTSRDYVQIRIKIEEVLSTVEIIKALFLLGSGPYEHANVLSMLQNNPKLQVITSLSVAKELNQLGVPMSRIRLVESLQDMKLKLSTGDTLRIIPTPFAPERGSFMVYEEESGFLFTSQLFSSLCTPDEFSLFEDPKVEDVMLYASLRMPCSRVVYKALDTLKDLRISKVFPIYGNPINQEALGEIIKSLRTADMGIDLPSTADESFYLQAINRVIAKLKENMEEDEFSSLKAELEKYVYLENDAVKEAFVSYSALPEILVVSMQYAGINPRFIKQALKELFYQGVVSFTIL